MPLSHITKLNSKKCCKTNEEMLTWIMLRNTVNILMKHLLSNSIYTFTKISNTIYRYVSSLLKKWKIWNPRVHESNVKYINSFERTFTLSGTFWEGRNYFYDCFFKINCFCHSLFGFSFLFFNGIWDEFSLERNISISYTLDHTCWSIQRCLIF